MPLREWFLLAVCATSAVLVGGVIGLVLFQTLPVEWFYVFPQ